MANAVCDYVYEKALGEHGPRPRTRYEAIPDDWSRSDCGVTHADFFCFDR